MSLPRNITWVQSATAAASFTTSIAVEMDYSGSVQLVYKGLDATDATFRLQANNDEVITNSSNLTNTASTLTTAASSVLYNIDKIGFKFLVCEYDAGSNSAGTVSIFRVRKQVS